MSKVHTAIWASNLLWLPRLSYAEIAAGQSLTAPLPIITTESMLQLLAGLLAVLAFIILIAWLCKKIGLHPAQRTDLLKVISSTHVGQKERIVIAEINDVWLVLGIAPGQINLLYQTNRKAANDNQVANSLSLNGSFNEKLQVNLKQNHEQPNNTKQNGAENK